MRETSVAAKSGPARPDAPAPAPYPVLLRLPDVSHFEASETLVHITPLMVESALESVGSGGATTTGNLVHGEISPLPGSSSAANTFASLLAASPTLQRTPQNTTSTPIVAPLQAAPPVSAATVITHVKMEDALSKPTTEQVAASARPQQRIDQPVTKPLRRLVRTKRPSWLPNIPPTLVLGLLICFTALLIGMLWPGHETETPPGLMPAAQETISPGKSNSPDKPNQGSPHRSSAKVATVPEVPELKVSKSSDTTARVRVSSRPKPTAKKPQSSTTKAAKAKAKPVSDNTTADEIPAPQITGIRALPPVNAVVETPFYGQPVGGPRPHIVENPHAVGQNPVFEARRPGAEFQGNITKPDAATSNERY